MNEPLLISPPYGYQQGVGISLTLNDRPFKPYLLAWVLWQYSAHKPAIPKIVELLRISGRYDCYLQAAWFKHQRKECIRDLAECGVLLKITDELKR